MSRLIWSPLALRFPLLDPDRFLQRTLRWVQPLFGWFGIVMWLLVVGTGVVLAASHWTDLTHDIQGRVLDPKNLVVLWLVVAAMVVMAVRLDLITGLILFPYLAWLCVACALNYSILRKNPSSASNRKHEAETGA